MKHFILFFSLFAFVFITNAQVYLPDSSFGINGQTTFNRSKGSTYFYDVEVQTDGKTIAAGNINNMTQDFLLQRFLRNGKIDPSFGNMGSAIIDLGGEESLSDIALQADGKIVVCGRKTQTGKAAQMIIIRLNNNGSIDQSFGNNGRIEYSNINGSNVTDGSIRNIVISPNQKISAIGYAFFNGNEYRCLVQRFTNSGQLDSGFAANGTQVLKFSSGSHNYGEALHLLSDGKLLILGSAYFNSYGHRMARLKTNGMIDSTFGKNGISITAFSGFSSITPGWISALPDGKIIASGYAYNGTAQRTIVSRHTANGFLDSSFGTNGFTSNSFGTNYNYAYNGYLHKNGDIILPVEYYDTMYQSGIIRMDSLGTPVAGFGNNGQLTISLNFEGSSYATALVSIQDSLYLVGGEMNVSNRHYQGYLTKLNLSGLVFQNFGTNGKSSAGNGTTGTTGTKLLPLKNGQFYITGILDNYNLDQFVAKLNADGSLVSTFGNNGFASFDLGVDEDLANAITLDDESILLLAKTGNQFITFSPNTFSGPKNYSLSVINADGTKNTSLQKNFSIVNGQFPRAAVVRQDSNGNFIVLASSSQAVVSDFYLCRHKANLDLDVSYGNAGRIKFQGRTTSQFTGLGDMQIAPDNDAVVLNWFSDAFSNPYSNFTVTKYKSNGSFDPNFGTSGRYTNKDTVGKDPNSAIHLWKFNNGYYIDYYKDGLAKIVHLNFNGNVSTFGTVVLDSIGISNMLQLPDSSFMIIGVKDEKTIVYHYFANGQRDTNFNSKNQFFNNNFQDSKSIIGSTFNSDKSLVFYHRLQTQAGLPLIGLSKFSLRTVSNENSILSHNFNKGLNVYPNPFISGFYIDLSSNDLNSENITFTMSDVNGKNIPIEVEYNDDNTVYIKCSENLPNGIYILCAKDKDHFMHYSKLIKN